MDVFSELQALGYLFAKVAWAAGVLQGFATDHPYLTWILLTMGTVSARWIFNKIVEGSLRVTFRVLRIMVPAIMAYVLCRFIEESFLHRDTIQEGVLAVSDALEARLNSSLGLVVNYFYPPPPTSNRTLLDRLADFRLF